MNKEVVSNKQAISIIILFLIGESSIFVEGIAAKKDLWLAIIITIMITLLLVTLFARLQSLFPGKDLFDIIEICFGKYIGKVIIVLYTWFAFDLISFALIDFGFMVKTVAFPETPILVPIIFFATVCAYGAKAGIEVLGRWSKFFVVFPIFFVVFSTMLLIPKMDVINLFPVLYDGIKPVMEGVFLSFSFPFGYMIGLPLALSCFQTRNSPYKAYIYGLLIGGTVILATSLTNLLVLGAEALEDLYYPSYFTVSRIKIGEFLQRLEIISVIIYMMAGFIELCIWITGASKGITKLFHFKDYKFIVLPITLLAINLTTFEFRSVMHYFEWSRTIWQYYVLPFEAILPIIIWIAAEIIARKRTVHSD
jgi:spore germination protein KB